MRFSTTTYHPNIDPNEGDIHLDVLSKKWWPGMTILSALSALVALLLKPEPFKLQDANAAAILYKKNFHEYRILAESWTKMYA